MLHKKSLEIKGRRWDDGAVEAYMAGLTGCAITGLVVVGWPIIGPGCTELPGIHPENLNFDIVYINQEINRHCRHYWAGVDRAVRHSS